MRVTHIAQFLYRTITPFDLLAGVRDEKYRRAEKLIGFNSSRLDVWDCRPREQFASAIGA